MKRSTSTIEKEVLLVYRNAMQWINNNERSEESSPNFQIHFSRILNRMDMILSDMDKMVCTLWYIEYLERLSAIGHANDLHIA